MIAYALGITELDPIKHGLLFERFLNPERISMPDIDMDFDERRRSDMIRYATAKYGEERVAQIITYGSIKAKAAIKDSARVLGYPYALGDRITKAMPPDVMGKGMSLAGAFDPKNGRYGEAAEFRALYESDPDTKRVVDTAKGLEGLKRQPGVHAAGVILCREPLLDVIPLWRRDQDGAIITQFDMGACEKLGLLKMDFLGLRNLSILDDCLQNIEANRGEVIVLEDLTLDDRPTYDLLTRGDTLGVFQLDGGPMRALLRSMQPDNFEDISAVLALYRPGPMGANAHNDYADRKNGRKPVVPIHPQLEAPLADILGDTYGLIVYQEQVMAIAQKLAGYSLGAADLLRRAMGKKKKEILDEEYVPFRDGMKANGYSDDAIKKLWEILVPFSDYAFNKAHTAGYGLVSYWTGFLKANYPAEYMAALLTSVKDDKDKSAVYLNECRKMGIKVLPPDVNDSDFDFTPRGTDIRFGLSAIRNVGGNVVDSVIATRRRVGRFADFHDFIAKVDASACNKRVVESLIKSGAFDSLGHTRKGLVQIHEQVVDAAVDIKRAESHGQYDLFGGLDADGDDSLVPRGTIPIGEWDKTGAAGARTRDARPVRLRPPAARSRAHARAADRSDHRRDPRRRQQGELDRDGRGPGDVGAAQDDEEGLALGDRHPGGPRGLRRGDGLPAGLRGGQHAARRRLRHHRQGAGRPHRRRRPAAHGHGDHPAGSHGGGERTGAPDHGGLPLHPAARREAQGGPGRASRARPRSTCTSPAAPRQRCSGWTTDFG